MASGSTRPRISDSEVASCLLHWDWESMDWVTLSSGVKWRKLGMVAAEVAAVPGTGTGTEGGAGPNSEDRKSCSTLVLTSGSSFNRIFPLGCSLSRG